MKKERNSFFESSNFNMSTMGPMNMNSMGNMGMMAPSNINAASSNFYASQNMPMPLPIYPNIQNGSSMNELESRIAKLERNINRLDARITKLEGNQFQTSAPYDSDGNMYMV